ncbi:ferric reductase transmembrane component 5 [Diutina rugosa]
MQWRQLAVVAMLVVPGVMAQWGDRYSEASMALFGCFSSMLTTTRFCHDQLDQSAVCVCELKPAYATLVGCVAQFVGTDFGTELAKLCPQNASAEAIESGFRLFIELATDDHNRTDVPVNLTTNATGEYVASFRNYLGNYNTSVRLAVALVGYWGVVFLIHALVLWLRPIIPKYNWGGIRTYLTTPALGRFHKDTAVTINGIDTGLIPSRVQSVVIMGFMALTVYLSVVDISYPLDDKIFAQLPYPRTQALAHMIGDRCGVLATFLIPLLVAFAGRNNLLQWLTGVNYATFVCYHRWISRVVVAQLVVHAIAFTVYFRGRAWTEYRQTYMIGGILGLLAMLVLVVQAFMALRRRWYEAFLAIHITASVVMVGASVVHLWHLGWSSYIWYALGVWVLDRVARVVRIMAFGAKRAQVTLIDDTLKVVIPCAKSVPAGGHVFLHFFTSAKEVWQSHPFTYILDEAEQTMVVFIKVKQGLTAKIANRLVNAIIPTEEITVLVDGPYGEPAPYLEFDRVVFIAGGHGIPGLFNELQTYTTIKSKTPTRLLWVSRSHRWFHRYLGQLPDTVDVELYSTTGSTTDETTPLPSSVKVEKGRPSMAMVVAEEVAATQGSIAFVGCGHPALMDDLRAQVAAIDHSHHVEFFDQLQVWA